MFPIFQQFFEHQISMLEYMLYEMSWRDQRNQKSTAALKANDYFLLFINLSGSWLMRLYPLYFYIT